MSSKWDSSTLKAVQAIWALFIATVIIGAALFYVLPHLLEDGQFSRDDVYFVAGLILLGVVVALPGQMMQLIGKGVTAFKAWKTGGAS